MAAGSSAGAGWIAQDASGHMAARPAGGIPKARRPAPGDYHSAQPVSAQPGLRTREYAFPLHPHAAGAASDIVVLDGYDCCAARAANDPPGPRSRLGFGVRLDGGGGADELSDPRHDAGHTHLAGGCFPAESAYEDFSIFGARKLAPRALCFMRIELCDEVSFRTVSAAPVGANRTCA